jgi:integrase
LVPECAKKLPPATEKRALDFAALTPSDLTHKVIPEMLDDKLALQTINGAHLDNQPFEDSGIRVMTSRYCKAAEIQGVQCSCHTFHHTFAKLYLLNGGDMFTLKSILGHERMETTEYYVELFSHDLQIQHEKFSPVEHLAVEFSTSFEESGVSQQ